MKKIPVWKNLLLIFALIVSIIIATLTWFITSGKNSIQGMVVSVGEATYIEISGDEGNNWGPNVDLEVGLIKYFKEISGNGTTFFKPNYDVVEDEQDGLVSKIISFDKVEDGDLYYEYTFLLRSDSTKDVYLDEESYIKAISPDGDSCIDGAVRVAFYELDDQDNETLKYIWAPNSTVAYSKATNTFVRDGAVESNYFYQLTNVIVDPDSLVGGTGNYNLAMVPTTTGISGNCPNCGYDGTHKFMWSCSENLPDNAPSLTTINVDESEDLGYQKLRIRVWLEGHDRECVSLINGQRFTMNFQFSSRKGE